MLKVSQTQLDQFGPAANAMFARRLAAYIKDRHPRTVVRIKEGESTVEDLEEDRLVLMARAGIERAGRYGITWESQLSAFVVIMFQAAPNFDEHPLIRRVLSDERIDPNQRIADLWQRTSPENWAAARRAYDPAAWEGQQS